MKPLTRQLLTMQGELKADIAQRLEEFATELMDQSEMINRKIDSMFAELIKKVKDP